LVDQAWPSALPAAARQGLDDLLIAVVLGGVGWRRLGRGEGRAWLRLGLGSALLLGVPATLAGVALGGGSEVTVAALFGLAPVAVVVLVAGLEAGAGEGSGARGLLMPALSGLAGILLVLPVETPGSWREAGFAGVALIGVLMAAAASVWMYRLLRDFSVDEAAAVCAAANAAYFLVVFAASGSGGAGWSWSAVGVEAVRAVGFDLPQVVLLVWLMRVVTPVRFAARFLVIPLFTVAEGFALMRPQVSLRVAGGAALVVFGAWRLLTARLRDGEPGLMLR
jgi:drug/metabolite transporter (DMT)-like permease